MSMLSKYRAAVAALILMASIMLLSAADPAQAHPIGAPAGYSEVCEASYYGAELYGSPTASGTIFYGQPGYAAHPWLPLGSKVLVENLNTGQSTVLTIFDRGPYIAGRCLDVSAGSNWIVGGGVAPVRVTAL